MMTSMTSSEGSSEDDITASSEGSSEYDDINDL